MTFANPSYLWAFAGLAIPIAIHLLSRKEGRVIRVGSLRHVDESNTSQFKSIRLNEILLLLLRCLMISLVVLFLSDAQCTGKLNNNIKWVVAEHGISVDSLVTKGYEFHEMPGENYWSYVEELNKLPYEIVVMSYSHLDDFKGERIHLNDNIKWITAESPSKKFQALAWRVGDSVLMRTGRSNAMVTTYQTSLGVPDSIEIIKPPVVNVSTSDKTVRAALNVLRNEYKLPIEISNDRFPITNIRITPSIGPFVERLSPTEIHINKNLDQDIALNDNLVIDLFKVLYPELQQAEANGDVRVLPDEIAFSNKNNVAPGSLSSALSIEKYLIILFLITLAFERFVAIRKNQ